MKTSAHLVAIANGRVLLLLKKETWILPGGKHEGCETDQACILRECSEEIPEAEVTIGEHIGNFCGITPNNGRMIVSSAYRGTVAGSVIPGAEINDNCWITKSELDDIPVSEITRATLQGVDF